jgi:excisionase family DNA binding protein
MEAQVVNPIAITISNAVKLSGLSRSTLYKAMKASEFATIKRGHRRLINFESLRRWLEGLQSDRWEDTSGDGGESGKKTKARIGPNRGAREAGDRGSDRQEGTGTATQASSGCARGGSVRAEG